MAHNNINLILKDITSAHFSEVIERVNNHEILLCSNVNNDYPWHYHATSDELLILLEGELKVEFSCGKIYTLQKGGVLHIPSGLAHRSFCKGKTVNFSIRNNKSSTYFISSHEELSTYTAHNLDVSKKVNVFDINAVIQGISSSHKVIDLININNHKLVIAINEGQYNAHEHPNSDEAFFIYSGTVNLQFLLNKVVKLKAGDLYKVPQGITHKPEAVQRSVILFFELIDTKTKFKSESGI